MEDHLELRLDVEGNIIFSKTICDGEDKGTYEWIEKDIAQFLKERKVVLEKYRESLLR